MRPSRCSFLQPQEELQVAIRPHHHITFALPEIASPNYAALYAFFVFVGVVVFLAVSVVFVVLVSFAPPMPLYALP